MGKLHAGHEPSWVSSDQTGGEQEGEYIELGPDETHGQLRITVQAGMRFVAGGVIAMQQLWQVSSATILFFFCFQHLCSPPAAFGIIALQQLC